LRKTGTHSPGMSPLQRLILDRMRGKGWTAKQVEDRGVSHATLHRYMNPVQLRQPPRKSVLQSLATALDLPLRAVEQAAVESVGYDYTASQNGSNGHRAPEPTSVEEAIIADPALPAIAKAHLLNQVELLRQLRTDLPAALLAAQQGRRKHATSAEEVIAEMDAELAEAERHEIPAPPPPVRQRNAPREGGGDVGAGV
jgi:hypothetical protein